MLLIAVVCSCGRYSMSIRPDGKLVPPPGMRLTPDHLIFFGRVLGRAMKSAVASCRVDPR